MTIHEYNCKFYTIKIIYNSIDDYDIDILVINNITKFEYYLTKGQLFDYYINKAYDYIDIIQDPYNRYDEN